jgi:hypothetical protein
MFPGMCRVGAPTAFALAMLCGGCSLILDFDKPPEPGPIDAPVTEELCLAFEPNESPTAATVIAPGDYMAAICLGETDFYRITLDGSQGVFASITFDNRGGDGDIDLRLLSTDGATAIDESRTSNNVEDVMCPGGIFCNGPLPAGEYLLQVLGFNAAVESAYVLHLDNALPAVDAGIDAP